MTTNVSQFMMRSTRAFSARSFRLILIAMAIVCFGGAARAQEANREEAREDKTLAPYFFVKGDPSVDSLPLKDTRVDIAVSGVIADVMVVQTYRNEGSRPINASYVFPASTRAAVYGMRMRIGDQIIVAKIKERQAAKQEFDEAKERGKERVASGAKPPQCFFDEPCQYHAG